MITSGNVDLRGIYGQSQAAHIAPITSGGGVIESFLIPKIREVIWDDLSLRQHPSSVMRGGRR